MNRGRSNEDDPLNELFQIEDADTDPIVREALRLIVRMLEDIEGLDHKDRVLSTLLIENEGAKSRVISLLNSAIRILEAEVAILGLLGYTP